MGKWIAYIFTTMVLFQTSYAASNKELGKQLDLDPKEKMETPSGVNSNYQFDLSEMKKPPVSTHTTEKPLYLISSYSISPHIGIGYSDQNTTAYSLGIQYISFKSKFRLEYSFDLYNKGAALTTVTKKWYLLNFPKWQGHAKAGLGLYLNPSQGIATIVDVNNLGLSFQFGIEKILEPPVSLRFDIEFYSGKRDTILMINSGYSWAW